uniref:NADH dehydrogenase [ubiquinone] 1 beta subcomplex subunit 4 n=1 Tax=Pseudodiaptomus poplesia TaxID=213370 RepID=A0A1S6GLC9_9MAXI|nr:putative protein xap-5 [Pseudodiaptomus poplesia]
MERTGGGTPYSEILLEEKRRRLRQAMKAEFVKKRFDPKVYEEGGVVFDAAIQRWNSLQFSYGEFFKPSLSNFSKYVAMVILPIAGFHYLCFGPSRTEFLKKCREGELAYDHPSRKRNYFAF